MSYLSLPAVLFLLNAALFIFTTFHFQLLALAEWALQAAGQLLTDKWASMCATSIKPTALVTVPIG